MKINFRKTLSLLFLIFLGCTSQGKWGKIDISKDAMGHAVVTLENSQLFLEYGYRVVENRGEGMVRKFYLKKQPDENIPHMFEGAAHRGEIQKAEIIDNGSQKKTVRIEWVAQVGTIEKYSHPAVTEISIFPDSRYFQLDYKSFCYPHICDIGHPGGLVFKRAADTISQGQYVIYGAEEWQKKRMDMDAADLRKHENPHHQLTNDLYPCYPNPLIDKGWVAVEENPLSYRGWYILGVYNKENGRGFGRLVPVDVVPVIKLLWGKGFELFPFWNEGGVTKPFTSFVFVVNHGAEDILTTGKNIIDSQLSMVK